MNELIKVALMLAALFSSTFLVLNMTGILTIENIEGGLLWASGIHPVHVAALVIALLFADLFIAIPTLTVSILAGYFLGFPLGGMIASVGMLLAGCAGYMISWRLGPRLLPKLVRDKNRLTAMRDLFNERGAVMLILCRAMPILPEVCCCLAGANRFPFSRFLLFYSVATVPYAFIASFAGSHSTFSDPMPAILTSIGMSLMMWLAWFIFIKRSRRLRQGHDAPPGLPSDRSPPSHTGVRSIS